MGRKAPLKTKVARCVLQRAAGFSYPTESRNGGRAVKPLGLAIRAVIRESVGRTTQGHGGDFAPGLKVFGRVNIEFLPGFAGDEQLRFTT